LRWFKADTKEHCYFARNLHTRNIRINTLEKTAANKRQEIFPNGWICGGSKTPLNFRRHFLKIFGKTIAISLVMFWFFFIWKLFLLQFLHHISSHFFPTLYISHLSTTFHLISSIFVYSFSTLFSIPPLYNFSTHSFSTHSFFTHSFSTHYFSTHSFQILPILCLFSLQFLYPFSIHPLDL
jgi:hypothetical protein